MDADDTGRDESLERTLRAALTPQEAQPPQERVDRLRALVDSAREAGEGSPAQDRPGHPRHARTDADAPARPERRRLLAVAAGLALLAGGGAVGAAVEHARDGEDLLARGTPEFSADLSGSDVEVSLEADAAPEGRIITLRSDSLPVVPPTTYYELWFVTEGSDPQRISAGTFHPDAQGSTLVVLHAAVDPSRLPLIEVTRVDGTDPGDTGTVVATGTVVPR